MNHHLRRLRPLAAAGAVALSLLGLSAAGAFGATVPLGESSPVASNPNQQAITYGENQAAKKYGMTVKTLDANLSPDKQVSDIDTFINLKVKGIITWTLERSDLRKGASQAGFYYYFDPAGQVIKTDSDVYIALDVLARDVGIVGIFSDWPATVTYYANCTGLK